ncbi:hypothetical protein [Gordonia neofelifaecis]|uniref:Uncharacterized protein n=1 Tax=Gordonia neofelifaecis NRRL B-59395 TaxID=644548 RepID=F1YEA8_9ACTN|nr:hypothetical protein [Gordonia neofelifaecis]EGD56741.1 hypothetical protein SCNU_00145 [Gordonia neofelifaecis NRRL B-59395]
MTATITICPAPSPEQIDLTDNESCAVTTLARIVGSTVTVNVDRVDTLCDDGTITSRMEAVYSLPCDGILRATHLDDMQDVTAAAQHFIAENQR